MNYFTSDLHLGHQAVIGYCQRPFVLADQMNKHIVKNWNLTVEPNDTVFVLGDMSYTMHYTDFANIVKQLTGKIVLIQGNHDQFSTGQYKRLGIEVYQELKIKLFGRDLRLSHFPYAPAWHKKLFMHKRDLRFLERRPHYTPSEILLHGHTHAKKKLNGNMIHVGVDAWNFWPASESAINSYVSRIESHD